MESILTSIKKLLGIAEDDTNFDPDVIMNINLALSILTQIGVGPSEGFVIKDSSATWNEFVTDILEQNMARTYVHLKARLIFDPPASSAVMESIKQTISEIEWRLQVASDSVNSTR